MTPLFERCDSGRAPKKPSLPHSASPKAGDELYTAGGSLSREEICYVREKVGGKVTVHRVSRQMASALLGGEHTGKNHSMTNEAEYEEYLRVLEETKQEEAKALQQRLEKMTQAVASTARILSSYQKHEP